MDTKYVNYHFSYFDDNDSECVGYPAKRTVQIEATFDDGATWVSVAEEFFKFLSNIYGYHIDLEKYANKK